MTPQNKLPKLIDTQITRKFRADNEEIFDEVARLAHKINEIISFLTPQEEEPHHQTSTSPGNTSEKPHSDTPKEVGSHRLIRDNYGKAEIISLKAEERFDNLLNILLISSYSEANENIKNIKSFISSLLSSEYDRGAREIQGDIHSVLNMLDGDTDRVKIANYIREYIKKS